MKLRVAVLGVTGSVGQNTLEVLRGYPDRFSLVGVQCHNNLAGLAAVLAEFAPQYALITGTADTAPLAAAYPRTRFIDGLPPERAYREFFEATRPDKTIHGIVGIAGLWPTWIALDMGLELGLANKESIVSAGPLLQDRLRRPGAGKIIPVDSEHNALWVLLEGRRQVERLVLTSSGGPFLNRPLAELDGVTVEQAVRHPNWVMGQKISVDSATMVNKSLEILEAAYLFHTDFRRVTISIHPQSIIHGMVRLTNGAYLAYMAAPTMEFPIGHALFAPDAPPQPVRDQSPADFANLTFYPLDERRFPSVPLAYHAGETAGSAPLVYNAANEVAVERFLRGDIRFTRIVPLIEETLARYRHHQLDSLAHCLETDAAVRQLAGRLSA